MSLFGSVSAFGKKPGPSAEQQMLRQVLQELQALREQMRVYHEEEMAMLKTISSKLDHLENEINRQFRELALEVALIRTDLHELMADNYRRCNSLVEGFVSLQVAPEAGNGLSTFEKWFSSANRPQDFSACVNGLIERQRVDSETDFSGSLRSVTADNKVTRFSHCRSAAWYKS